MASDIIDNLRSEFQRANWLNRLIYVNIGVFILFVVSEAISYLSGMPLETWFARYLSIPSVLSQFIRQPWSLITYMFVHFDFFHILVNLIVLFFSGRVFIDFLGDKRILPVYMIGGILGGLVFIVLYNISPNLQAGQPMVGASAGVMAILVAAASKAPTLPVRLFFILEVKFWMVAAGLILIDISSIRSGNTGGHLAHLAGAAFGYLYVRGLNSGRDISNAFWDLIRSPGNLLRRKPRMRTVHRKSSSGGRTQRPSATTGHQTHDQARMDEILDKIKAHGYDKLTKEEKDFLFQFSRK